MVRPKLFSRALPFLGSIPCSGTPFSSSGVLLTFGVLRTYSSHSRWFNDNGLQKYYPVFVQAGFNAIQSFKYIEQAQLAALITLPGHRKKMNLAVQVLRGDKISFDRLYFSVPPTTHGNKARVLPPFEVLCHFFRCSTRLPGL